MLRFKFTLLLSAVFLLVMPSKLLGQAARSPFSSFGYGDYHGESLVNAQGMAGTGVANPQSWYLNNQNPALLVYNRITVIQAGLFLENKSISSPSDKGKSKSGNLNYLAIGFPAFRDKVTREVKWATSVGLMPYSTVNYSYNHTDTVNGLPVQYVDRGQGGFNQFYWSNGVNITKNLNIGLKTAFMFSSVIGDFLNVVDDPKNPIKFAVSRHELQSVKGVKFTPGFAYRIDSIAKKYTFNIGATYEFRTALSSHIEQFFQKKTLGGTIINSDTVKSNNTKITFPSRLSVGVSFGRPDFWMVASDFTLTSFGSPVAKLGEDQTPVQTGWRWSLGGEVTPDVRSLSSYLKRVTYRMGVSAEQGTYLVSGNPVKDFGINFGLSFPVNRISSVDLGFRTGRRGDKKLNGIEENYFKIYFGVTFNDNQWFIKRRFD